MESGGRTGTSEGALEAEMTDGARPPLTVELVACAIRLLRSERPVGDPGMRPAVSAGEAAATGGWSVKASLIGFRENEFLPRALFVPTRWICCPRALP